MHITTDELVSRVRISDIFQALGGELHHMRGRAFWRNGDGWNVSLCDEKGCWHDFATGESGGVVGLIVKGQGCSREEAFRWLADYCGIAVPDLKPATAEQKRVYARRREQARHARWWAIAAQTLAEELLDQMSWCHPDRAELTRLVSICRASRPSLETEFRWWYERHPEITAGLVEVGREFEARVQRNLALFIASHAEEVNSATA